MEVHIDNSQLAVEEFTSLRNKVGWGETCIQLAQIALSNSLFHVGAYSNKKLVGMARIVGDGAMFFLYTRFDRRSRISKSWYW